MTTSIDIYHQRVLQILDEYFGPNTINGKIHYLGKEVIVPYHLSNLNETEAAYKLATVHNLTEKEVNWTCTDPNTGQFGRKISDAIFEFKQVDSYYESEDGVPFIPQYVVDNPQDYDDDYIKKIIYLSNYTEIEIEEFVSGYYDSLDNLKIIYKEDSNWMIAECIFEMTII
jgi:hypothetical protein